MSTSSAVSKAGVGDGNFIDLGAAETLHQGSGELPYSRFASLLLWFVVPGLLLGFAFQHVYSAIGFRPENVLFSDWIQQGMNGFLVIQFLLIFGTTHFFTTTVAHRISSVVFSVLISLGCVALNVSMSHHYYSHASLEIFDQDWPTMISIGASIVIVTISVPFFRALAQRRVSIHHYPTLFEFAWNQCVVFLLGVLFVGVVTLVLAVSVELFKTIGVQIGDIIWDRRFIFPLLSASFALAVGISRHFSNVLHALVHLVTSLFRAVLPLHLILVVLFLFFIGINSYTSLGNARDIKLVFIIAIGIALTLCTSAIGAIDKPLSSWLNVAWRLMSFAILIVALLAIWLIVNRIDTYGPTHFHLLASIITAVGLVHAIGYTLSALLPKRGRQGLQVTNIYGAILSLCIAVAIQLPPFDLVRFSVNEQINRIQAAEIPVELWRLRWLDKESGSAGQHVLDTLYEDKHDSMPTRHELSALSRYSVRQAAAESPLDKLKKVSDEGTLKVISSELSAGVAKIGELELLLYEHREFDQVCIHAAGSCRVVITDKIEENKVHAVILIAKSNTLASVAWLTQSKDNDWESATFRRQLSDLYDYAYYEPADLKRIFANIDNNQFKIAPIQANGIHIGEQVFYPRRD